MSNQHIHTVDNKSSSVKHLWALLMTHGFQHVYKQRNKLDQNGAKPASGKKLLNEFASDNSVDLNVHLQLRSANDLWIAVLLTTLVASLITYLTVIITLLVVDFALSAYHFHTLTLTATGLFIFALFEKGLYGYKQFICTHFGNTLDQYFLPVFGNRLSPHSIRFFLQANRRLNPKDFSRFNALRTSITEDFSFAFFRLMIGFMSAGILMAIDFSFALVIFPVMAILIGMVNLLTSYLKQTKNPLWSSQFSFCSMISKIPIEIKEIVNGLITVIVAFFVYRLFTDAWTVQNLLSLGECTVFIMLSGKIMGCWPFCKQAHTEIHANQKELFNITDPFLEL